MISEDLLVWKIIIGFILFILVICFFTNHDGEFKKENKKDYNYPTVEIIGEENISLAKYKDIINNLDKQRYVRVCVDNVCFKIDEKEIKQYQNKSIDSVEKITRNFLKINGIKLTLISIEYKDKVKIGYVNFIY